MNINPSNYSVFRKTLLHFKTIHHHRMLVMKHCFSCGLYRQGLLHDLSKYSYGEFVESVKYFQGTRSPYMYEKELFGYAPGWLHHKGRNKHHWEYWYDTLNGKWTPIEMPFCYVVEMVCDRVAACQNYEKENYTKESALAYFQSRPDAKYMHPETAKLLESILKDIAVYGEQHVFQQLKQQLKDHSKRR